MGSDSSKVTPFGREYYHLKKGISAMPFLALMQVLGEYMNSKRKFQLAGDLRREQEATMLMDVCHRELERRGCPLEDW